MISFWHDYDYFKAMKTPFWKVARKQGFPKDEAATAWGTAFRETISHVELGFEVGSDEDMRTFLFDGVGEATIRSIRQKAITIDATDGDLIIPQGRKGKFIGLVQEGRLEVRRGDELVAVLHEGDLFGEVSVFLDVLRTADIVAVGSKATIVVINMSVIDQVTDLQDQVRIWKNIARVIALRLVRKPNGTLPPISDVEKSDNA